MCVDKRENEKPESAGHATAIVLDSQKLMQGQKEVQIRHGAEFYRLRETSNGKLILNK